jgi:hypothetical protein
MVLMMGFRGTNAFCILRNSHGLTGLEPTDRSSPSSVSEELFICEIF